MKDKLKELNTSVKLVNDKLLFMGTADNNEPVSIDYIAPLGDDMGYTSLELFLLSFSSCLGSALLTLLRRMQKSISNLEIKAKGLRNEDHPTGFKSIHLHIYLTSSDTSNSDVQKVIGLAEEKYCPVWAMIKGNTIIETTIAIIP